MKERKLQVNSNKLCEIVLKGMQDKKALDIVLLDLNTVKNSIADYFIICTGTSDTHIDAISESVEQEVNKIADQDPWHKEGKINKEWILLDYVDVVVHIFKSEIREFYSIEDLWGDAVQIEVEQN
ncbi:MAG: ribosome silencing factor [Candidatus Cyclobacteriaceae bacterium M3_2C_046]